MPRKKTPLPSDKSIILKTEDGKPFEVPEEGSLGLLALGAVGLAAWRRKRREMAKSKKTKK